MSFDFVNDWLSVHHNGNLVEKIALNGSISSVTAFSMCNECNIVEIMRKS